MAELLRSSVEKVGGSAAVEVEEDTGASEEEDAGVGVVNVVRKAPRRGLVRIRRGTSSRIELKVRLWLMSLFHVFVTCQRVCLCGSDDWEGRTLAC